jgi:hypothetical protein
MLTDPNSQSNSVVLRGIEVDLDSDIGYSFIIDCARYLEGTLSEDQVKEKYQFTDANWERLAENKLLVQKVHREKERRITSGIATKEKAQRLFFETPDVLDGIIHDTTLSPRYRVDAVKELRAVAASGSEQSTPARSDRFVIRIDLSAGGGEVLEFDKELAIESKPGENEKGDNSESVR